MDENDKKEGQGSDKYQGSSARYVFLSPCLQKESNRLTDLCEKTKSLNHLVWIPKLPYQIIANFVLEFLDGEGSKDQKKIYIRRLQGEMESHLAFTTSTASSNTKV